MNTFNSNHFNSEDDIPLLESNYNIRKPSSSYKNYAIKQQRKCLISIIVLMSFGIVLMLYYQCPQNICQRVITPFQHPLSQKPKPMADFQQPPNSWRLILNQQKALDTVQVNFITYEDIQEDNFDFDMNGTDVMVFLHIQKTGGTTFGKHLVQDIDLENPCLCRKRAKHKKKKNKHKQLYDDNYDDNYQLKSTDEDDEYNDDKILSRVKRKSLTCKCFRPGKEEKTWLFSRYSTGWKCGVHADWTELTECVDNYLNYQEGQIENGSRRYFYITFLRDPVSRYLSEFYHVQRGATWHGAENRCNGIPASPKDIPLCYDGEDWSGVDLEDFMKCKSNLALNRQTRMLSNLRLVNCYNISGMSEQKRNHIMLQSAKENLIKMTYFGLTEMQHQSQILFEDTFNLKFKKEFFQYDQHSDKNEIEEKYLKKIRELNSLDIELYNFAKKVMLERFKEIS